MWRWLHTTLLWPFVACLVYGRFERSLSFIICSICCMCRVGTNFWLKIGKIFLGNLFQILKKPFDVKRSSESKYAILMSVSRREVHEFWGFMRQKSLKIDLQKMFKTSQADFYIYGVSWDDQPDYKKISGRRGTEQSEIGVFPVILGDFGAWSDSWGD